MSRFLAIMMIVWGLLVVAFPPVAFGDEPTPEEISAAERLAELHRRKAEAEASGEMPSRTRPKTPEEIEKKARKAEEAKQSREKGTLAEMKPGDTGYILPYRLLFGLAADEKVHAMVPVATPVKASPFRDERYSLPAIPVTMLETLDYQPNTSLLRPGLTLVVDWTDCDWRIFSVYNTGQSWRLRGDDTSDARTARVNFLIASDVEHYNVVFRIGGTVLETLPKEKLHPPIWQAKPGEYWMSTRFWHRGISNHRDQKIRDWVDGWAPVSTEPFTDSLGPAVKIVIEPLPSNYSGPWSSAWWVKVYGTDAVRPSNTLDYGDVAAWSGGRVLNTLRHNTPDGIQIHHACLDARIERQVSVRVSPDGPTVASSPPSGTDLEKSALERIMESSPPGTVGALLPEETGHVIPYQILVGADGRPYVDPNADCLVDPFYDERYRLQTVPIWLKAETDGDGRLAYWAEVDMTDSDVVFSTALTERQSWRLVLDFPDGRRLELDGTLGDPTRYLPVRIRKGRQIYEHLSHPMVSPRIWEVEPGSDCWVSPRFLHFGVTRDGELEPWVDGWAPVSFKPFKDSLGAAIRLTTIPVPADHAGYWKTPWACTVDLAGVTAKWNTRLSLRETSVTDRKTGDPYLSIRLPGAGDIRAPSYLSVRRFTGNIPRGEAARFVRKGNN